MIADHQWERGFFSQQWTCKRCGYSISSGKPPSPNARIPHFQTKMKLTCNELQIVGVQDS